jgi:hypothetical protein
VLSGLERADAAATRSRVAASTGSGHEQPPLLGGFADLAKLHRDLDIAVAAAYGWPASVAQNPAELVERLTKLNRQIAAGERAYHPFPDPDELG